MHYQKYYHFMATIQDNLYYWRSLLRSGGFCWSKFYCQHAPAGGNYGEDARVLLNGDTFTISVSCHAQSKLKSKGSLIAVLILHELNFIIT